MPKIMTFDESKSQNKSDSSEILQPSELDKARLTIESLKQQLEKKTKEFENEIAEKTKYFESQLKNQQNELHSQLEEKSKELEKISQEKRILEIQLQNHQNSKNESTKAESIKQIQLLDSKSMQDYEIIEELGIGSSGRVVKVVKKIPYALKIMNTNNATVENLRYFMNEYEIMVY